MLNHILNNQIFYEIIFEKEPYILEWKIGEFELLNDGMHFPDKYIGVSLINESMIDSIIFLSYEEARERLDFISKDGVNMCPHCLLMIVLSTIGSGAVACLTFLKLKFLNITKKMKQKHNRRRVKK